MPDDLEQLQDEVETLYAGPLEGFVAQRKELQARAKREFPAIAARVGALRKPTRTAYAVNRLRSLHRSTFDAVVRSGVELRDAIGRGDPSQALKDRQTAISRALDAIEEEWGETPPTPAQRQQMAKTLQAISVGIDVSTEPTDDRAVLVVEALRGRLTADLDPPGLEVLMGLQPGRRPRQATVKAASASPSKNTAPISAKGSAKGAAATSRRRKAQQRLLEKKIEKSMGGSRKIEAEMEAARKRVLDLQDQLEGARARRAELRAELDAEVARRRQLEAELRSL